MPKRKASGPPPPTSAAAPPPLQQPAASLPPAGFGIRVHISEEPAAAEERLAASARALLAAAGGDGRLAENMLRTVVLEAAGGGGKEGMFKVLPDELVFRILSELPVGCRIHAGCHVCTRWRHILFSPATVSLWEELKLSDIPCKASWSGDGLQHWMGFGHASLGWFARLAPPLRGHIATNAKSLMLRYEEWVGDVALQRAWEDDIDDMIDAMANGSRQPLVWENLEEICLDGFDDEPLKDAPCAKHCVERYLTALLLSSDKFPKLRKVCTYTKDCCISPLGLEAVEALAKLPTLTSLSIGWRTLMRDTDTEREGDIGLMRPHWIDQNAAFLGRLTEVGEFGTHRDAGVKWATFPFQQRLISALTGANTLGFCIRCLHLPCTFPASCLHQCCLLVVGVHFRKTLADPPPPKQPAGAFRPVHDRPANPGGRELCFVRGGGATGANHPGH